MAPNKIIMLAGSGFSTDVVYNTVNRQFPIHRIVMEAPVDKKTFIRRRIKKMGFWKVGGQILFQLLVVPILTRLSAKRAAAIIVNNRLDATAIPESVTIKVSSINNDEIVQLLQQEKPDLVLVNGTRIISKKVLNAVSCRFINIHAGITPKYRGVHGVYWALANNDLANAGVTVHLVDPGIDTGGILYQARVTPDKKDNFATYPILQLAAGLPLLLKAIEQETPVAEGTKESALWYHPTVWYYLWKRVFHGVK